MQFHIIPTEAPYRQMLAESDPARRVAIFREALATPFEALARLFNPDDPVAQWVYGPQDMAAGHGPTIADILDRLAAEKAWDKAAQALQDARRAITPYLDRIPLTDVVFGLFPYRPATRVERGYSGFGGVPGWVMVTYSDPNAYSLPRIQGATVHELHHNIRFCLHPFNIMTATLADYIIAEGLAESFAAELYGESVLGYYVTDFDESALAEARRLIGGALNESDFAAVRGYIFGDTIAQEMGLPQGGVPDYGGYAIGYRVVQAYLRRTAQGVIDAPFLPAHQLIAESGFFAETKTPPDFGGRGALASTLP